MSKPSLILIGAGGHAHACIDVIEEHGGYRILGLVGTQEELNTGHLGYSVIAADSDLPRLAKEVQFALVAVGQIQTADPRIQLYRQAIELGFNLPSIVAPTAHVSRHARVGAGTIVLHGAMINAGARVGSNCIINTSALVEHDAVVEDHCHVSTGAILNGRVHVGAGSFVGSGSCIKQGVKIGTRCVIGMGLAVRHSQTDNARFLGSPKS